MITHRKLCNTCYILLTLGIVVAMGAGCQPPPPSLTTPTVSNASSPVPLTPTAVTQNVSPGAVPVDGQPRFLFGANYPWHIYGIDFGENAWGHNGVSAKRSEVETDFDAFSAMGVRVVRWFVFADGRAAPEFAADGSVTGLDGQVYPDLDAALEIAQEHNVRLILVLLDFQWLAMPKTEHGVPLGAHADTIQDPAKRQTFYQQALLPLLARYGKNPYILAWEVINEPEWAMSDPDIKTGYPLVRISPGIMQSFVRQTTDLIHQNASQMVTLGSASRRWWDRWENVGLDLCQVHYYPWMEKDTPLAFPYSGLNTKLPCILGEFPSSGSGTGTDFSLDQLYQTILNNGYAGAFPWSLRAEDAYSKLAQSGSILQGWARKLSNTIELPIPVDWVPPTPLPTVTAAPSVTLEPTSRPSRPLSPTLSLGSPTAVPPGSDPAMYGFELRDDEWAAQTDEDSQAVTAVSRVVFPVYKGKFSLQLDVNLVPKDAHLSQGEAYVDMLAFPPIDNSVGPYNFSNSTITCRLYLPAQIYSANLSPWIGLQVFVKDTNDRSEYGSWTRFRAQDTDQWLSLLLKPRVFVAPEGYKDAGFDPSAITTLGVKIGVDDAYAKPGVGYTGPIYMDACTWK